MLARLQQTIVITLITLTGLWIALGADSLGRGLWIGLAVLCLGHAAFLALEFGIAARVNRKDPSPAAGLGAWLRAWVGESRVAPSVFFWRQPFRAHALPDALGVGSGQRGVVFIHGFFCNRGLWSPWLERLQAQGTAFAAVNLEPLFGSIDDYAPIVQQAVDQVRAATGLPPLLVCHSMGGLAARAWLRASGGDAQVWRVVTIATPHHGTWPGRFSHAINGRQMSLNSRWLQKLASDEPVSRSQLFTCYHSNCDNIVFPTSSAMLEGADNRFIHGVAHVAMAYDARVMREVLDMLRA